METVVKDEELMVELQEVYLTGKQWLSDLEFMESEQHFLREQLSDRNSAEAQNLMARLDRAGLLREELWLEINNFMNKTEALIVQPNGILQLQLIEDFIRLQTAIASALAVLKGIKYALVEYRRAA